VRPSSAAADTVLCVEYWKRSEEPNSFPDDPEPSWSADPGELRRQLRETGLEAFEDRILEGSEPAVLLRWMAPSEHESRESRIGGRPDLPPDAAWPEHAGAPMIFLCQVRLAELAGLPGAEVLPDHGVLSFWCADTDEVQGIWKWKSPALMDIV
jgi:hypothetical protein